MTPRTQGENLDTRDKLIRAAAQEFARHGYNGASLRQICASAGVTTGALYFFFKNKEDLFKTVIAPVAEPMASLFEGSGEHGAVQLLAAAGTHDDAGEAAREVRRFLGLCYERRSLVQIMVGNRDCSAMQAVLDEMAASLAVGIREFLEQDERSSEMWDAFVVEWLADVALRSVMEILEADDDLDDARRHMAVVAKFVRGGARELRSR